MKWLPALLAGGTAGAIAFFLGTRKAHASEQVRETPRTDVRGRLKLRTTAYWPFTATEAERAREGGIHGAALWRGKKVIDPSTGKRPELYTLEDAIAGKTPYASLSGDPAVWPIGQRLEIDTWPGVVFRIVDTGANFKGAGKKQRVDDAEPIDVCVESKKTKMPELTGARIVYGDNWEGGAPVAVANIKGQNVITGYQILGGLDRPDYVPADATAWDETGWFSQSPVIPYTEADCAALARAITSSCSQGTIEEKQAIGWVCRNRASKLGIPLLGVIAPSGYGPRGEGGRDFVSTELPPDDISLQIAKTVLTLREEEDPTGGAFDFWNPKQQDEARLLADVQAIFSTEPIDVFGADEVREALAAYGLHVVGRIGDLELLA